MKFRQIVMIMVLCGSLLLTACGGENKENASLPLPSGSLDTSFGTGGKVTTVLGTNYSSATAVAVQTDGKIVAVGESYDGTPFAFGLARYNVDGSLDTSFGTGGKVTTAFGTVGDTPLAVVIQTDGKIVAVGYSNTSSGPVFALARYKIDGSLDESFGPGGKVTTAIGTRGAVAYAAAIQSDGKIVVAGYSDSGTVDVSVQVFALARYNADDGSLDMSFGTGGTGTVTTSFGPMYQNATSVVIQTDGKIVAAGRAYPVLALARYNSDGSLDESFGPGGTGKVTTAMGDNCGAANVAIQTDGKIVAGGTSWGSASASFALARYNTDGRLDTSFGVGGKVTTDFGTGLGFLRAVAIQTDGKIVAAGSSSDGTPSVFTLVRYNNDGSLDANFGTGAKVTTAVGTIGDEIYAVAIQSDGKIVAAGYSYTGTSYVFALARYLP
jgi:uncharacterized delta-60 repeat protein